MDYYRVWCDTALRYPLLSYQPHFDPKRHLSSTVHVVAGLLCLCECQISSYSLVKFVMDRKCLRQVVQTIALEHEAMVPASDPRCDRFRKKPV